MIFPHEDPEFSNLVRIVAKNRKLSLGLVEKDYWITHSLWALHQGNDLEVWFKGGTSLSKGFGLIHRFSEDLDLRIDSQAAGVAGIAWPKKPTKTQRGAQVRYFEALGPRLIIPGTEVTLAQVDPDGRGAAYKVTYPGQFMETILPPNSPFVKLEIGRAQVTPFVPRAISSFIHDHLGELRLLPNYGDNRPGAVRCVHPWVTLLEKLDALAWRFEKQRDPAEYIRHYEDAAHIIHEESSLPPLEQSLSDLADALAPSLRFKRVASSDHPAFSEAAARAPNLQAAHGAIEPMFWAPRIALGDASGAIREWLTRNFS